MNSAGLGGLTNLGSNQPAKKVQSAPRVNTAPAKRVSAPEPAVVDKTSANKAPPPKPMYTNKGGMK